MPRKKAIMLDLASQIDDALQPCLALSRTVKPPLTQAWSERRNPCARRCTEATEF
jgi:hypothetical protein